MRYLALILVILAAALLQPGARPAGAQESRTFISGGSLASATRFTAVDEDAFVRRISAPPRLAEPPATTGPAYVIRTPYWAEVMPGTPGVRPAAGEEATYYPQGGYVRATRPDSDTWLVLDPRQQAIIERYIRLGEKRLISPQPSALELLRAEALSGGAIGVQIAGESLSADQSARLWKSLEGVAGRTLPTDILAPSTKASEPFVVFTLPEGRTVQMQLLPRGSDNLLIEFVGGESYSLPLGWLGSVLGDSGAAVPLPARVPQEKGAGSPSWWPIMLGGGVTLLAAALFLRRRANPLP